MDIKIITNNNLPLMICCESVVKNIVEVALLKNYIPHIFEKCYVQNIFAKLSQQILCGELLLVDKTVISIMNSN